MRATNRGICALQRSNAQGAVSSRSQPSPRGRCTDDFGGNRRHAAKAILRSLAADRDRFSARYCGRNPHLRPDRGSSVTKARRWRVISFAPACSRDRVATIIGAAVLSAATRPDRSDLRIPCRCPTRANKDCAWLQQRTGWCRTRGFGFGQPKNRRKSYAGNACNAGQSAIMVSAPLIMGPR